MALSTIMGTSYACLGAVRNLENVGKRMGADLLVNFRELRKAEVELPRIPLLRTRVNRVLERVVGRPLAPGARFVYSRWRVKNPRWVGERKDKSKVTQYTNQQLEDILTEQGRDT